MWEEATFIEQANGNSKIVNVEGNLYSKPKIKDENTNEETQRVEIKEEIFDDQKVNLMEKEWSDTGERSEYPRHYVFLSTKDEVQESKGEAKNSCSSTFSSSEHKPSDVICSDSITHSVDVDLKNNSDEVFKCNDCNYQSHKKGNLKTHILSHSDIKSFQCQECDFRTKWKANLSVHLLQHTTPEMFKCSHCSYETKRKDHLKQHIVKHSEKNFKCAKDQVKNSCLSTLSDSEHKPSALIYSHATTHSSDSVDLGLKSHSDEKVFKCKDCNYQSNKRRNLYHHIVKHSDIKSFQCPECDFKTKRNASLSVHLLQHTTPEMFKCSHCSYETKRKDHLKYHIMRHSETKKFRCAECSYECNRKVDLKIHKLNDHSVIKLFKCTQCNYGANRKDQLRSHLLNHSVVKMFKCSKCEFETNRKRSLADHTAKHYGRKVFTCSECNHETNTMGNLNLHKLNHSKEKLSNYLDALIKLKEITS